MDISPPSAQSYRSLLHRSLEEDHAENDLTSNHFLSPNRKGAAKIAAKEDGVITGTFLIEAIYSSLSHSVEVNSIPEGTPIQKGDSIAEITGPLQTIFAGERTVLNFLQQLSGISTTVKSFTKHTNNSSTRIIDTRKTTPGWRTLEKYAVQVGGGTNHRMHLEEMVLLKDNHLQTIQNQYQNPFSTLGNRLSTFRDHHPDKKVEIEVSTLPLLSKILPLQPDRIMLDNMNYDTMKSAIKQIRSKNKNHAKSTVDIELSGGVHLNNLDQYLELEPDYISVGRLTHSIDHLDLHMKLKDEKE